MRIALELELEDNNVADVGREGRAIARRRRHRPWTVGRAPAPPVLTIIWASFDVIRSSRAGLAPSIEDKDVCAVLALFLSVRRVGHIEELDVVKEDILVAVRKAIGETFQGEEILGREAEYLSRVLQTTVNTRLVGFQVPSLPQTLGVRQSYRFPCLPQSPRAHHSPEQHLAFV
jgi:hypothetical protein